MRPMQGSQDEYYNEKYYNEEDLDSPYEEDNSKSSSNEEDL